MLRHVFGHARFRPLQKQVIDAVVAGRDAFVLMPTGGGKSLCYQVPALLRPGTAVVVSPLISLMKDQVDRLRAHDVRAAFLNSALERSQTREVLDDLDAGNLDLLYVAPERLLMGNLVERLHRCGVALLAVDEAHCVSTWGHDFRPEYAELGGLRQRLPAVPLLALTATADPHTRRDVGRVLGISEAQTFVAGFDRPNIHYRVRDKLRPRPELLSFVRDQRGESGIVYCLTRKRVEQIAELLRKGGIRAAAYHAGLEGAERQRVQEAFAADSVDVVVATVAFGMGIDKSDVRFVVHFDLPMSLEAYYQETGRAGRDGEPSIALAYFGTGDVASARRLLERGGNPDQIRIEHHKLDAMVAYAAAHTCRRRALLSYFGEVLEADCGNCDVCLDPPETFDATVDAQKALSCVYRVGQRFGLRYVVAVLRGADDARIQGNGHDRLSTFGIGADQTDEHWAGILRQLIHRGYLIQDPGQYATLRLDDRAKPLLRGEATVDLARPRPTPPRRSPAPRGAKRGRRSEPPLAPADMDAFEALRALRGEIAREQGGPAYRIFTDATLREMCRTRPRDAASLLAVSGVGPTKLERYGPRFLACLAAVGEDPGP